jgi:23S rRNA (guanosine2251-2'-O)-methyltransferase
VTGRPEQIEGRRPVIEALRSGREVSEIRISRTAKGLDDIRRLASRNGVRVRPVPREEIDRLAQTRAPQGVIAFVSAFSYTSVDALLARAESKGESALLVALDGVTDPGNLGAVARSAEAAGAHGLILPGRRSASIGAGAEKTSAGALEHLPVARVVNLQRALHDLAERGVWIVALDASADAAIYELPVATEPLCLVIGGEGTGVSRLVAERADHRARIPMSGRVASLNAAAAAAVALFEIGRRRRTEQ